MPLHPLSNTLEQLAPLLDALRRDKRPHGLLCCRFRHFDRLEALYGPDQAELLMAAGQRCLSQQAPEATNILRTGPAELTLVAALHSGHDAELITLAAHLCAPCSVVANGDGPPLLLTVAIGGAVADPHQSTADQDAALLSRARLAMHTAEQRAGNQWVIATPGLQNLAANRYHQEAALVRAVQDRELTAAYQPIVALQDGRVIGFECLARWRRRDGSLLSPVDFLDQAQAAGITAAVDLQVLEASLEAAAAMAEAAGSDHPLLLSANISAQLMDSEGAQRDLLELIADHPLPTGIQLQLELLEECLNEADPGLEDLLQHLADRHVRIAIDDFGTGYSSLSRLHNLAIHGIKVDRSFIQRINAPTKSSNHMLDMLVAIGVDLSIRLTAEGVETEEQRLWLLEHGIDTGQGFLFDEPLDLDQAIERLRAPKA